LWTDSLFVGDEKSDVFYVPEVIFELTTKRVLTSERVYGDCIDKLVDAPLELRNWVSLNNSSNLHLLIPKMKKRQCENM
jgi:predicted unusual protein kinase regulating ubiquinone biosynthesis (AarF/ABC1/UbiB family)